MTATHASIADRLVVIRQGQARIIEGDYETYQHLEKEKDRGDKSPARTPASSSSSAGGSSRLTPKPSAPTAKPKRKFSYRKAADIEREIGELEHELRELEHLLGQPATWRDPVKARELQLEHEDLKAKLARLYEHWEEAVEFDT